MIRLSAILWSKFASGDLAAPGLGCRTNGRPFRGGRSKDKLVTIER
jgi:hypothetical protein